MAISAAKYVNDTLRAWWDDDTETYHEVAEDGVTPISAPRPYTSVELEEKAERVQRSVITNNSAVLLTDLRTSIQPLLDSMAVLRNARDTGNGVINANPAQYIKGLANQVLITDRTLVKVTRIIAGELDTTDSGAI